MLFRGSLADSIRYARPEADDDEVMRAASKARLSEMDRYAAAKAWIRHWASVALPWLQSYILRSTKLTQTLTVFPLGQVAIGRFGTLIVELKHWPVPRNRQPGIVSERNPAAQLAAFPIENACQPFGIGCRSVL